MFDEYIHSKKKRKKKKTVHFQMRQKSVLNNLLTKVIHKMIMCLKYHKIVYYITIT